MDIRTIADSYSELAGSAHALLAAHRDPKCGRNVREAMLAQLASAYARAESLGLVTPLDQYPTTKRGD